MTLKCQYCIYYVWTLHLNAKYFAYICHAVLLRFMIKMKDINIEITDCVPISDWDTVNDFNVYTSQAISVMGQKIIHTFTTWAEWIGLAGSLNHTDIGWMEVINKSNRTNINWNPFWNAGCCNYMGEVTKLRLSCYLVLLPIDSKTR